MGSLQAAKSQSPAEICSNPTWCGRRGLEQSPQRPLILCLGGPWVCDSVGGAEQGTSALSRVCFFFSRGHENQDAFPWGLLCPIKLKQIILADGITALTSYNLFPSTCWLGHIS